MSRSRKSGRQPPDGPELDPAPGAKRRRAAAGELAEGALAGDDVAATLQKQAEDRQFWSKFATIYLFSWLADYEDAEVAQADEKDREKLLSLLVTSVGVKRPHKGKERQQLQAAWRRVGRVAPGVQPPDIGVEVEHPAPPKPVENASSSSSVAKKPDQEMKYPDPSLSQFSLVQQQQLQQQVQQQQLQLQQFQQRQHREEQQAASMEASKSQQHAVSASSIPVGPLICMICAHRNPVIAGYEQGWRCEDCGLRGDLDADHPSNILLASRSKASGSSGSSGSGQSHETPADATSTVKEALRGLDGHFAALTLKGPTMPAFEGVDAAKALTPAQAHAISRRAVGASALENVSESLQSVIRAGKLPAVGYAMPRRLDAAAAAEETDVNASALYALGINPRDIKSLIAPPVPNSRAFCNTIFSVIIPCLIDRPAAIMEWATLARSALELESLHGSWPTAYSYVQQLLNERIAKGEGFSNTSVECLSTLWAVKHAGAPASSGSRSDRPLGSQAKSTGACNNWNSNRGCSLSASACRYRHACGGCGSNAHKTQDPACKRPGGKPQQRGSSGSTVASVASKSNKAAAAAAASE